MESTGIGPSRELELKEVREISREKSNFGLEIEVL